MAFVNQTEEAFTFNKNASKVIKSAWQNWPYASRISRKMEGNCPQNSAGAYKSERKVLLKQI